MYGRVEGTHYHNEKGYSFLENTTAVWGPRTWLQVIAVLLHLQLALLAPASPARIATGNKVEPLRVYTLWGVPWDMGRPQRPPLRHANQAKRGDAVKGGRTVMQNRVRSTVEAAGSFRKILPQINMARHLCQRAPMRIISTVWRYTIQLPIYSSVGPTTVTEIDVLERTATPSCVGFNLIPILLLLLFHAQNNCFMRCM